MIAMLVAGLDILLAWAVLGTVVCGVMGPVLKWGQTPGIVRSEVFIMSLHVLGKTFGRSMVRYGQGGFLGKFTLFILVSCLLYWLGLRWFVMSYWGFLVFSTGCLFVEMPKVFEPYQKEINA